MRFISTVPKDVLGGILFFILGTAVAVQSVTYKVGTLHAMGPGFFPLVLGIILAGSGVAIGVKGHFAAPRVQRAVLSPEWKSWVLICLSIATFIVLARYLGLAIAAFAIVFISALADRTNTWLSASVLALAMVAFGIVVFWWALQIQLPLFKWGGA